jgi:alcohol dehydrogenase, propanol-preferring
VGGHEGVGRIIAFGPSSASTAQSDLALNTLVGIRFLASVCHACEYCVSGREQHCTRSRNHLHHIDGSFQEYAVLDRDYLTLLPQDIDPKVVGPVLCAGLTTFKVCG